jgi:hypothetical protein
LFGPARMALPNISGVLTRKNYVINQLSIAELASEYWKLLQAFERSAVFAPDSARARLNAQLRYSSERLNILLEKAGLRIVSFDGLSFEVNLPAIAVNAEDIPLGQTCVVERTLEPAVVADGGIIMTGKVFIAVTKSGAD